MLLGAPYYVESEGVLFRLAFEIRRFSSALMILTTQQAMPIVLESSRQQHVCRLRNHGGRGRFITTVQHPRKYLRQVI